MKMAVMTIALATAMVEAAMMPAAQAQTFTVLHQFDGTPVGGKPDGEFPRAALLRDSAGNLFGTTSFTASPGGGEGVAFKLDSRNRATILFEFDFSVTGGDITAPLIQDRAGNLYGIAEGGPGGAGVVFKLTQKGEQTVLFQFQGGPGP